MKQAKVTRHPWLIVCDANMCPEDFERSLWFQSEQLCGGPKKKRRHEDQKAQKMSRSKEHVTMSLRVAGWKTLSRGHTKQCTLWSRETRRCRNGMSRRCPWRCLVTEDAYGAAWLKWKKAVRKKREEEEKEESGMKSLKKWLRASWRRQARMKMPSRPHK